MDTLELLRLCFGRGIVAVFGGKTHHALINMQALGCPVSSSDFRVHLVQTGKTCGPPSKRRPQLQQAKGRYYFGAQFNGTRLAPALRSGWTDCYREACSVMLFAPSLHMR